MEKKINIKIKIIITVLITATILALTFFSYKIIERKVLYPIKYKDQIISVAEKYGIEKALMFSVVKVESGFKKDSTSEKGAIGLMQITKSTGEYISTLLGETEYDLYDVETNLKYGGYYLRYLINKFNDIRTVLCAYNAGEGKVKEWLKDKRYSKDGERIDKTPYAETEEYVSRIEKCLRKYRKLYFNIVDKNQIIM